MKKIILGLNSIGINTSAALIIDNDSIMFSNATLYSNPVALLKKGRLVKVVKCKIKWCKVKSGKFKGWVKKNSLWGLL